MQIKRLLTTVGMAIAISSFCFNVNAATGLTFAGASGHRQWGGSFGDHEYDGYATVATYEGQNASDNFWIVPMSVPYISSGTQSVTALMQYSIVGSGCSSTSQIVVSNNTDGSYYAWASAGNTEVAITIPAKGTLFAKFGMPAYTNSGCATKAIGAYYYK